MDNGPFCCTRTTARFTCSLAAAPTCNAVVVADKLIHFPTLTLITQLVVQFLHSDEGELVTNIWKSFWSSHFKLKKLHNVALIMQSCAGLQDVIHFADYKMDHVETQTSSRPDPGWAHHSLLSNMGWVWYYDCTEERHWGRLMLNSKNLVAVVVSLLVTLIEGQIMEMSKLGITTLRLEVSNKAKISRHFQLLSDKPEPWQLNSNWDFLPSRVYHE